MTKVLHIITRLIAGGADENTVFTCEGLDPEKYKVDLVVGGESELDNFSYMKNTNVIKLASLVRNINPVKDFLAFWQLVKLMRTENYDIVHTHTAKAGILGRAAACFTKRAIVVHSLHGATFHTAIPRFQSFIYKTLEKITIKWTTKVISVGDDLKNRYLEAGVGHPEQYITIRSGFDLSRFLMDNVEIQTHRKNLLAELGLKDSAILIGSASRLESRKGHGFLIDAVERLIQKNKNVHLVIAGDGAMDAELKQIVHKKSLTAHIHFVGFRNDIQNVMAGFDIFSLTSLWEGLPRVLVQAASLGKPIVTFAVEGASEMVKDGENGFIVELRDVDTLHARLAELIEDLPQAHKMGQAGRSRVCEDWHKDSMVNKIEQLYGQLI